MLFKILLMLFTLVCSSQASTQPSAIDAALETFGEQNRAALHTLIERYKTDGWSVDTTHSTSDMVKMKRESDPLTPVTRFYLKPEVLRQTDACFLVQTRSTVYNPVDSTNQGTVWELVLGYAAGNTKEFSAQIRETDDGKQIQVSGWDIRTEEENFINAIFEGKRFQEYKKISFFCLSSGERI